MCRWGCVNNNPPHVSLSTYINCTICRRLWLCVVVCLEVHETAGFVSAWNYSLMFRCDKGKNSCNCTSLNKNISKHTKPFILKENISRWANISKELLFRVMPLSLAAVLWSTVKQVQERRRTRRRGRRRRRRRDLIFSSYRWKVPHRAGPPHNNSLMCLHRLEQELQAGGTAPDPPPPEGWKKDGGHRRQMGERISIFYSSDIFPCCCWMA